MTVLELIEKLLELPLDMEVFVMGGPCGNNELEPSPDVVYADRFKKTRVIL